VGRRHRLGGHPSPVLNRSRHRPHEPAAGRDRARWRARGNRAAGGLVIIVPAADGPRPDPGPPDPAGPSARIRERPGRPPADRNPKNPGVGPRTETSTMRESGSEAVEIPIGRFGRWGRHGAGGRPGGGSLSGPRTWDVRAGQPPGIFVTRDIRHVPLSTVRRRLRPESRSFSLTAYNGVYVRLTSKHRKLTRVHIV
jgi:hypothetical protein